MKKLIVLLIGCLAVVLASTVRAQTSGVNNAELNGDYAFRFDGISGSGGGVSSAFAAVGRFTADGAGNLTNGEIDTNSPGGGAVALPFTGTYAIGADHRGLMTFAGATFAFAMMANGNAQFIKFDAGGGAGTIGSGTMEKVDTTAYNTAKISGDYAFGLAGQDNLNNRAAFVGRFTSNGAGTLTNAAGDANLYGTAHSMSFTAANYTVSDPATGRGSMNLAFSLGGAPSTLNFVFYIVNAGKLFAMESDAVTTSTPLATGVVLQQQSSGGGFSNASLNGNMVTYQTGLSMCGNGTPAVPKAVAGLLTANGNGGFNFSFDENFCRNFGTYPNVPGTYSVASNGRAALTVGWADFVGYMVSWNQAFLLFTPDSNVLFGFGEPQQTVSFTNGDIKGTYAGYASSPVTYGVAVSSGEFAADGASPTGNITGTEDIGAPSGPTSGVPFSATYSVSSSPTNGRGTMTVTSGSGGSAVVYAISTSKFVSVSMNDPNPAVVIFEQPSSSPSPVPTLSSLTLSPSTVTGGNSSTGTVTLSAPAPAGGAQVTLSSSNVAASVPSSVTVLAGAASATFTISTNAVTASTPATISASYGGVTQTATLTVTAPLPTLSSLTLSPSSVTGGNSSTGTVTLSGPAPTGGAQVVLSSSNMAASMPSSVTVLAGAASATFTISTSAVAVSTSVTISASYGGVTRTASLTVTSPILSSLTLNPSTVTGGNSSTGTVTLSGPAPAGGAQVMLSSSNTGVARVPSSTVVPAGATSATFTVNTSLVLVSTSVTISASDRTVTKSAILRVNSVVPLL